MCVQNHYTSSNIHGECLFPLFCRCSTIEPFIFKVIKSSPHVRIIFGLFCSARSLIDILLFFVNFSQSLTPFFYAMFVVAVVMVGIACLGNLFLFWKYRQRRPWLSVVGHSYYNYFWFVISLIWDHLWCSRVAHSQLNWRLIRDHESTWQSVRCSSHESSYRPHSMRRFKELFKQRPSCMRRLSWSDDHLHPAWTMTLIQYPFSRLRETNKTNGHFHEI